MATETRYPEWYQQHGQTFYPFEDSATFSSAEGKSLPYQLFLDARFTILGSQPGIYLSSVEVTPNDVIFSLSDGRNDLIATSSVPSNSSADKLVFTDTRGRQVGLFVVSAGTAAAFKSWGTGLYQFESIATGLAASTYMVLPEAVVSGFALDSGEFVSGDAVLVGGDGVVLQVEDLELDDLCGDLINTQFKVITVHIVGDPLFKRRLCEGPELFATPNYLKQICFSVPGIQDDPEYADTAPQLICCGPGEFGHIKIMSGQTDHDFDILRIRSTQDGILFETIGETL
jgi:hypothetical protein